MRRGVPAWAPGVVLALALLVLWQLLGWSGRLPATVPAPLAIAAAFATHGSALAQHAVPTLATAGLGLAAATVVSLALAALATMLPRAEPPISGLGIILDSVPLIALTPVLIALVGIDSKARIVVAALACFLPILVGAIQGFRSVEREESELFRVLAASRWTRLRLLSLPAALPYLAAAFKIAAPAALLGALVSEWAGAERGLGIMMTYAMFAFDAPQLWVTILATCLIAVALYGALAALERVVVR
jgi:ABC-type nitrate/sulfonate/bicarbonate transport system permease component